jgi:hypothetical protein
VCRLISNALRAGWFSPLDDAGFWAFDNGKFMEQNHTGHTGASD